MFCNRFSFSMFLQQWTFLICYIYTVNLRCKTNIAESYFRLVLLWSPLLSQWHLFWQVPLLCYLHYMPSQMVFEDRNDSYSNVGSHKICLNKTFFFLYYLLDALHFCNEQILKCGRFLHSFTFCLKYSQNLFEHIRIVQCLLSRFCVQYEMKVWQ